VNGHRIRGIDGNEAGIREGVEVLSIDGAWLSVSDERTGGAGVVGAAGSGDEEFLAREALGIRERAIRMVGGEIGVVNIIEHLKLAAGQPAENNGAAAA